MTLLTVGISASGRIFLRSQQHPICNSHATTRKDAAREACAQQEAAATGQEQEETEDPAAEAVAAL